MSAVSKYVTKEGGEGKYEKFDRGCRIRVHDEPLVYRSFLEEVLRGRRTEPGGREPDGTRMKSWSNLTFPFVGSRVRVISVAFAKIAVLLIKMEGERRRGRGREIGFSSFGTRPPLFFPPGEERKRKKERKKEINSRINF